MTPDERRAAVVEIGQRRRLYTVEGLARTLYEMGYGIDLDDLYTALKAAGWIKLRLIRDRLLEVKRDIPKRDPYSGLRQLVKSPLLVSRDDDLPEWKWRLHGGREHSGDRATEARVQPTAVRSG
jgi:hypothetical protein